jgi:hypothetical protein
MALIFSDLAKFSATEAHRDLIIFYVRKGAHLILDRLENGLLVPLSVLAEAGKTN